MRTYIWIEYSVKVTAKDFHLYQISQLQDLPIYHDASFTILEVNKQYGCRAAITSPVR